MATFQFLLTAISMCLVIHVIGSRTYAAMSWVIDRAIDLLLGKKP